MGRSPPACVHLVELTFYSFFLTLKKTSSSRDFIFHAAILLNIVFLSSCKFNKTLSCNTEQTTCKHLTTTSGDEYLLSFISI